ncbi:PhzF family phenazine biosynthesis protein [Paenibacillus lemnae]|uniref:PhzF family phenazine biosynthesis protein n=1 Tax=Paenibacillus lemnae TaxID=1330551 RepID=A0A848M8X5_PAELE|nr:PhzF family phenazine biosynthesis protein [Paenibacillus lemnae]NMO96532.1 PhzF family phenazine biosynthesis protein [Paenibacillus lemnae]
MNIYVVDAFTNQPYRGNPAAVLVLKETRSDSWLQEIASEMNHSETAFLLKQKDSYQLRWFTPESEVDLCGHATLASAHILWEKGFSQEEVLRFSTKSGVLTASRLEDGWICMNFPKETESPCIAPKDLSEGLGTEHVYVGKNRMDYLVEVDSEAILKNLKPDFTQWEKVDARGIIVTSQSQREGIDFVSRCFYPAVGVNEDPVTGSAHCCLGPYWASRLQKNELTAEQISFRPGYLKVKVLSERVDIQGQAVTTLSSVLEAEKHKQE